VEEEKQRIALLNSKIEEATKEHKQLQE
jgi:hypothetical protein